jgi:hypothetical protein
MSPRSLMAQGESNNDKDKAGKRLRLSDVVTEDEGGSEVRRWGRVKEDESNKGDERSKLNIRALAL